MHEIPGLMASRSLLLVRQWSKVNGMFYLATSSIASPRFPDPDDIVVYEILTSVLKFFFDNFFIISRDGSALKMKTKFRRKKFIPCASYVKRFIF